MKEPEYLHQKKKIHQLTSIIVLHVEVVANHVGHGGSNQVWLVHVEVDRDASSLGSTDAVGDTHA